jgi:hypothetical protein
MRLSGFTMYGRTFELITSKAYMYTIASKVEQGFLKYKKKTCNHFLKIFTNDLKSRLSRKQWKNRLLNPGTSSQSEGYSKKMANLIGQLQCVYYREGTPTQASV